LNEASIVATKHFVFNIVPALQHFTVLIAVFGFDKIILPYPIEFSAVPKE